MLFRSIDEIDPDAVFIDVVGIGAGVVDRLAQLGYDVTAVNGALKALEDAKYFNRRMEMWAEMRLWLQRGGMIEEMESSTDKPSLAEQLVAPEYGFDAKARIQLESKDDMKARNIPSPDVADALSMTFFEPVAPRRRETAVDKLLARQFAAAASTSHMAH